MPKKNAKPKPIKRPDEMNKTERRYADQLEVMKYAGEILDWMYETVKFKLAPKTYYTPDFIVVYPDHIEVVEIKGFLRDDAAVKFKTAAAMNPWFKWKMIRLKKGKWETVMGF